MTAVDGRVMTEPTVDAGTLSEEAETAERFLDEKGRFRRGDEVEEGAMEVGASLADAIDVDCLVI